MEGKGTVLLIEDSAQYQRIYGSLFKTEGYGLLRAMDGEIGMYMAKKKKPDIILMEIVLPKRHGLDIIREVRADAEIKEIPIIVFSVSGKEEDIQLGLRAGANDYLVKGYQTPREVMDKIRAYIGKKASELKVNAYQVMVYERKGDAARLQRDIGLPTLYRCPACGVELALELEMEVEKEGKGHVFKGVLMCPSCKRTF